MSALNDLAAECWQVNEDNGWHKPFVDEHGVERLTSTYEKLVLIHSEVTEAEEAFRKHGTLRWWKGVVCDPLPGQTSDTIVYGGPKDKLEGFPTELADIIIRTLALAQIHGVDIDAEVQDKLAYNRHRADVPVRDGAKSI